MYVNPGHHDPSSPDFRGGGSKTTHLPPDAEEVYRRAVPSDSSGNSWFGRNSEGNFIVTKGVTARFTGMVEKNLIEG